MIKQILFIVLGTLVFNAFGQDECVNAVTLTPNTTCVNTTGTFSGATISSAVPVCGTNASQDVWYKFTATDSTMSISLNSVSGLNHGFEVIQGSCGGTVIHCANSNGVGTSEGFFTNTFHPGQLYFIRVFNASASLSTSNFGICVQRYPSPLNDNCSNAQVLTPGATCTNTIGTFSGAMMNGGVPTCGTSSSQDVWYKFTATDSTMSISLNSVAGLNHGFEVIQGSCGGTLIHCANGNGAGTSEGYFNNDFIPGQEYYVRVFNASSFLSTLSFGICVQRYPSPANDYCANAQTITPGTTCSYTTGTFSGAMMNGGVPTCGTSSSQDVWYKFTATDSTMSIFLNSVSGLNHGFEVIQGGCGGTVINCTNAYSAGISEGYFNNNFHPGQEYYVRVFNVSPSLNTLSFGICVQRYPSPANDYCVNAQTITPGTNCSYTTGTFSGAMMNGGIPSCGTSSSQDVWYKFTATDSTMSIFLNSVSGLNHGFEVIQGGCGGTVINCTNDYSAGISEGYFNNNFHPGQEYYVRVFNVSPSLNTLSFGICVQKYPNPANDYCVNAQTITPGTNCSYTTGTFSGAMMNGGIPSCGTSSSQDVWYKFTATDSTMSIFLNSVSGLNHGFEVIQGGCGGTVINCTNAYSAGISEGYFNNNFHPGQEYYIRVFNASSSLNTSSFGICVQKYPSPTNDYCSTATELIPSNTCSYVSGTFSGAMMNGGVPACGVNTSQDVWYRFIATSTTMGVQLNAVSGLNHGFQVFEGSCGGTLVTCMNNFSSSFSESASLTSLTIGQTYYIRVLNTSSGLNTNAFGICLTGAPPVSCTPQIVINASTTTICQGQTITFNATPTYGGTTPAYQWKVNGSNVGTNNSTYSSNSLANGDVVTCVLTSSASCAFPTTATSNGITITVNPTTIPTFTAITAICNGDNFTLPTTSNNGISGTWSPAINNSATTTYTFTPTSGGTCVQNATMTVVVNNPVTPTFTQVPTVCSGNTFTLPTTSNNGISGTWSPAINNTATTTYTFTPNGGQCATTTTMIVTVNSATITPTFNQVAAICTGGSFTLPSTSTNGITGTWSPAINNTATTTYTFTPNGGQCATTATMTVTVNSATITPTFNQVAAICTGGTFTLPSTSTNGITGTWSPAINNTATTTYTFTPNGGQCATTTTMTVTVSSIDLDVTVQGTTLTSNAVGASYQWIDCFTNLPIAGATNATFTATIDGLYAVEVTQFGCTETSTCYLVSTVGIADLSANDWFVYPNPAKDLLNVDVPFSLTANIFDITGKVLSTITLTEGHNEIQLVGWSTGVYFIQSSNGTNYKFIKE